MMSKDEKLELIDKMFILLAEADWYDVAISHACYIKGMIGAWFMDGSLDPKEWSELYASVEEMMKPKYKLRSVSEGVPF